MTEQEAIKDLEFIRDGYKNLSENGADRYRAVGKGLDCEAKIETNMDIYGHYTEALEMAIETIGKQIPQQPKIKIQKEDVRVGSIVFEAGTKTYICTCGSYIAYKDTYCRYCGQRLDWE